ncbi:hypothetical protein HCN44_002980 [Aphidius gifuensis]|uniref:Tudor domain-containing protein n=1 Tax=Aphidius gifuensis TaxID=684658 RepID=A0A834XRV8_APHGI|nr:hypothetical protein HCN44_002980 [Aphidius gifuensis]
MPPVQTNPTPEVTYRNLNYTLLIQAHSAEFTENEIRNIFEKYGKIRRLKPTSNGKQAQLTYGNFSEAVAALQGVHDKPPLKLQVDYYKKNNDFVSRYGYTQCHISSVDPSKNSYRVRRVKDANNYKKFHEKLREASNKCSETIDADKLVVGNIYSIMYGGVWKRGKILSINPIEIDLIDDGITLKPPLQIASYKKLGKLADNSPFAEHLKIKASPDDEKISLHIGSYVDIRMIGQLENMIYVVRKSDETINKKKSSPCPAAIKINKSIIRKDNDKAAKGVDIKVPDDEKKINKEKKNDVKKTSDEKNLNIEIKKEHENNIDVVVIDDDDDDNNNGDNGDNGDGDDDIISVAQENVKEIDIDIIDVESRYNFENQSNESTNILQCDICIFDSLIAESTNEVSISHQIDSTTATAVFQYSGKESFQLLDKLKEHCNNVVQGYDNYKPSINEYICFKQSGHTNWYRGIVLSIGESIKCASLDQGIETTAHKIIPVPDMFKKFPALAVQLKTHDKFPYSIGDSADLYICDIDKESKTVIAKFTNVKTNSGVQISQWTPWINNEKSIDNAAAKVAEKIPTARIVPLNTPRVENSIPIVQEIRPSIVEKENIVIPVIEKCSSTANENPAPKIDKKITIKDFNLKNNSRVVVQSYLGTSVVCIASMELDDIVLKKELNQKICDTAKTSDSIDHPNVGDYVLACYNDNYYRAKVLSIRNKKIVADFIDFGLVEIIKPGNIKKMPESLMEHPSLMKQVTLKNVDNNKPTKEAANYIKSLFATEEILICSFDDNLPDKVELKTLDNESVNDEINKLSKKYDKENIISTIPNPKPQLRLNIIKREEIIGNTARKDANKKSSKKCESINDKNKSSTKSSSKDKSPEPVTSSKKPIISPIESVKPRKECGYCGKFNHETYECTFKKDSERRYNELRNQEIRRRGFEHYHDGRLSGPPRYPDIRSYDQTQRLYFDQLPVCPHESCSSNKSQYDPRKGPVKHCYQDCPFSQYYTPIY